MIRIWTADVGELRYTQVILFLAAVVWMVLAGIVLTWPKLPEAPKPQWVPPLNQEEVKIT